MLQFFCHTFGFYLPTMLFIEYHKTRQTRYIKTTLITVFTLICCGNLKNFLWNRGIDNTFTKHYETYYERMTVGLSLILSIILLKIEVSKYNDDMF